MDESAPNLTALPEIQTSAETDLAKVKTFDELNNFRTKYLGRKSALQEVSKQLSNLKLDQRKQVGQAINQLKNKITQDIKDKRQALSETGGNQSGISAEIDTSLPGELPHIGHLHPTTQMLRQLNHFFHYLGYSVYEGPEIETNEFNFDKLNLPLDHPARDLADTFYIHEPEYLLRTHTSSVETRAMTTEELPLRIVVPGKVYRNETTNSTNSAMFYQYEGLVIDKNLSMAELKGTLQAFAEHLYGSDVETRFRCKYYPQVEPGAGMDIKCTFCHGEGCQVCKYRGWIEVLGAGMVHPNALRNCGIDDREWSGFAFGMGIDRLVMLKYGIKDIRKLYSGELVIEEKV